LIHSIRALNLVARKGLRLIVCAEEQVGFHESGTGIIERDFPPHGLLARLESRLGEKQNKIVVPWSVGTESGLHKS
jgi:hypothetical protein